MRNCARSTPHALRDNRRLPFESVFSNCRASPHFDMRSASARAASTSIEPEARVRLDEAGRPQGVKLRRKNAATSLVEEMMIRANEVVAEHLSRAKFPCVYRVHEAPDLEGLAQLVPIFEEFPWFVNIDPVGFFTGSQHALQQAVSASRGRAEGEARLVACTALDEARGIPREELRPLWPRECDVLPLHKSHQALSRPYGAPHAESRSSSGALRDSTR